MIILEPIGGLANRMRAIASGLWLKEKLRTNLTVIWNKNYELNCPFNLLFEDPGMFAIKGKARMYNYVSTSFHNTLRSKLINKLAGIDFCIQEQDFYKLIWPGERDIYEIAKNHKVTYIQTCQEFGDNLPAFVHFKPAQQVAEKINSVVEKFTGYMVGVHIRRSDNANSVRFSPTRLFMEKIQAELEERPDARFFLCTDDPAEEKAMLAKFGDKVITLEKEFSRNSVAGMQDAATELFCLSRTQKIYGSYWSSFSDIAARLNNSKLEVLKFDQKSGLLPKG